jgi:hypothetical protein
MSIKAAFPLTPTISFIYYGKIMFDLCVFYLGVNFQERNYRVNREVAVYFLRIHPNIILSSMSRFSKCSVPSRFFG